MSGHHFLHKLEQFHAEGLCCAWAAETLTDGTFIWSQPLPIGTSAQRAKLIALNRHSNGVNIYSVGQYTFVTVHVPGATYLQRMRASDCCWKD